MGTKQPSYGLAKRGGRLSRLAASSAASVGALLCACVGLTEPSLANPGSASAANVHYGPDAEQVFDIWTPSSPNGATPLVLIFHGGGFITGDKHPCYPRLADRLLARGIAIACANYRLAPGAQYPSQMLDGARALKWLRHNHAQFGVDPDRIALMGASAGGAMALWLGFHDDLANASAADPVDRESTRVAAVVTSNAQATYEPNTIESEFHTRQLPKFLAEFFGAGDVQNLWDAGFTAREHEASPIAYLHAGGPPVLAYYTTDSDLPPNSPPNAYIHNPAQGRLLQKVAQQRGASLEFHTARDYDGWDGFLGAAADFLAGKLGGR